MTLQTAYGILIAAWGLFLLLDAGELFWPEFGKRHGWLITLGEFLITLPLATVGYHVGRPEWLAIVPISALYFVRRWRSTPHDGAAIDERSE